MIRDEEELSWQYRAVTVETSHSPDLWDGCRLLLTAEHQRKTRHLGCSKRSVTAFDIAIITQRLNVDYSTS